MRFMSRDYLVLGFSKIGKLIDLLISLIATWAFLIVERIQSSYILPTQVTCLLAGNESHGAEEAIRID